MKTLTIGDLKARIPIIQGGMGVGISLSGLASAVANEGGIGVISAAGLGLLYKKLSPSNYTEAGNLGLAEEIRKAREKAKGIIGVNVMVALSDFAEREDQYSGKGRHHFQRCWTAFGLAFFPQER